MIALGDMKVGARFSPKLTRALAVIATELHPAFDRQDWLMPGKSRESCVMCSLAVRDFLLAIGFDDAEVRSVTCFMRAEQAGRELHSLGIGAPDRAYGSREVPPDQPDRWSGHLVCTVPSERALIDTTLYPSKRPAWADALPGMLVVTYDKPRGRKLYGHRPIAGAEVRDSDRPDYRFEIVWLDRRDNNGWKAGGDCQQWRRAEAALAMRQRWGTFEEVPA
jgi:hypothetical protein